MVEMGYWEAGGGGRENGRAATGGWGEEEVVEGREGPAFGTTAWGCDAGVRLVRIGGKSRSDCGEKQWY